MEYYRRHLDDRMIQQRWMDLRLFSVRVVEVRNYLQRKGWKEISSDESGMLLFQEPRVGEEEPLYQWLPENQQRRDYVQAIYELLAGVAELENRSAVDVLTDILAGAAGLPLPMNGQQSSANTESASSERL